MDQLHSFEIVHLKHFDHQLATLLMQLTVLFFESLKYLISIQLPEKKNILCLFFTFHNPTCVLKHFPTIRI